jgi:VWFA-related protein
MSSPFRIAGVIVLLAGAAVAAGQAPPPQPAASQPAAPQGPTPTFKANVEYVEVDALVTDPQGQFVRGLTKDDFQVFEDGKRQTIAIFSMVDIPVERADRPLFAARPIEPDVKTNERPFDGRVYVAILDDLHTDVLRSQRVKVAARQFIERNLGANDLMAVLFTGGRSQDAQEFTSNKRLLLAAVDKFMGRKLPSPTITRNDEYYRQRDFAAQGSRIPDPTEMERGYNAQSMLTSLRQVADWFGGVRGRRKTMLLFSEGIDYDITDVIRQYDAPGNSASAILSDIRDTIAATARSNVSIYAIDPRGLSTGTEDAIGVTDFADNDTQNSGGSSRPGIGLGSLRNELQLSQDSLRTLADESGGFAAVNRNDFAGVFDRIVKDNSSYYVLAYYPPTDKKGGKFHKIEVKMTRPGLVARSRRGYVSAKPSAAPKNTKTGGMTPELFEAMSSPIPVSGLTMRAFATPFKGTAPNASVLVGVELVGRDLTLDSNSKVEISYMAIDAKAKIWGAHTDSLTLNLRPESRARVEETGVRILNRLDLPPGRYQVRVAARDAAKAIVGSIITDVDVPDFYKQPIGLSGIALTSMSGSASMTARPDDQLKAVMPAPPIAQRSFPQNDEVALFAEVYDNSGGTAHKVDIVTTVLTDEGKVLFKNEETRDSSELQGARGGFGYTTRVPMSDLAPGPYVLRVEAHSRLGQEPTVTREIQFTVVNAARGAAR